MSKLSSVAVLAGMPAYGCESRESREVSVRPIDNGFVRCTSECKDGKYTSKEEYFPQRPPLEGQRESMDATMIRDAVSEIKK